MSIGLATKGVMQGPSYIICVPAELTPIPIVLTSMPTVGEVLPVTEGAPPPPPPPPSGLRPEVEVLSSKKLYPEVDGEE